MDFLCLKDSEVSDIELNMVGDESLELRAEGPVPGPGEAGVIRELFVGSS